MKTLNDIQNVNSNAANVASNNNKINDFGQKIGGARKDLYQAAHEWAAQLADITAEALTKAGGVSKLVRLPNLESMTAAGAITADQARAALIIWRGIERKPQGSYRADRWAERTRHRLEAAAAVITATEPQGEDVADIIRAARESAEFAVISAAQWPAVAFSFGKYSVIRCRYSNTPKLQIQDARYYRGTASEDPADIARQLREMVSRDEEQAADRRAAGPALGVYMNRAGVYYIAPADRSEIVLQTYEDRAAALKAYREDRPALVARYTALKNFPACRREWNRPRVGEDWRKGENMTPEKYAAVLPFRGVEFGNWVNQTERAALLNSAFDGFHDLAAVLNIAPAAVTLNGSLAFAFASRGHSGAAAHYEPARRVINLTKKSGAGCMAHEWFHAVDNFAAGGGVHNYATERRDHPAAFAILEAIKKTDYYRRSQNLAKFKGDYWTEGRELTARAFEGVCAVMLNAAGICSDFLVNCKSMDEFTAEDVARRSDYYPYPTADEAAALLPLYVAFLKEVFGDVLTAPAACYEEAKRAAARAELQRQEAERIAAERAEAERQERERKAAEAREKAAREAEERRQAAAHAVGLLRDVLTARHLDAIATAYDSATAYAVGHLEGEIYTISADIKTADTEGRAYIESRPAACIQYKRVHNAKRIICHRWQVAEIRANKWNARELCEALTESDARDIVRTFADFEKADTWQKAATLWADTQRLREAQNKRTETTEKPATGTKAAEGTDTKPATADGLTMEKYSEKATVIRGYNAEQLAELLAMGGKEWRNLKGGKGVIFSTRRHGDELRKWMEAQQGEGTTAPAAETTAPASAPADDQQGESVPASLEPAQDITDTTDEPAAAGLPDWLRVGARVRTRGRFMMSTRSRRPQWVEGEEMTVKAINADFVELERRDESGALRGLESVATATAADELTPIYSTSEKLGEAVREWSANEYAATHHGATLTDWDKAHPAPVEWCKPGQVFKLAGRQIAGRDVYGVITKLGNDCFFYVGNFGSCSEHLTAYNCQQWENLQPVEIMHEDTPKFAKMFQKFHDIRKAWEADGVKIWQEREDKERTAAPLQEAAEISEPAAIAASIDTNEPETPAATYIDTNEPEAPAATYETSATADEQQQADALPFMEKAAILDKVTARIYAPWGDVSKMWLCPFRGANDVWNAWARGLDLRDFGRLADWALTAKVGERAEYRGLLVQIWERDGQTAAEPESEADRLTANRETRERLRAAIVAELEAVGAYIYPFNNEMKVFGKVQTVAELSKVEDIARRYSSAKFIHEDRADVFEFNFPLFFPHFFPTDPAPEPSGEGAGICHSFDTNQDTDTLEQAGEITAPAADPLADIISEAKKQESRTASGLNYGPIKYLRNNVLYANNGRTTAENMKEYEANLHRVTDPDTYAAYLLSSYDLFVDETQVYCDLRRVFPSLTFQQVCKLINDHLGENQQGDGIAAALVPDCVILASADEYTRRKFKERHDRYNSRRTDEKDGYNGQQWARWYDRESLALHLLLSEELFYIWESRRAARALDYLQESYPDATADELQAVFMKHADGVTAIYG